MSIPLAEALAQVELEPGRVYRCVVKGLTVDVHVLQPIPPEFLPAPLVESDILLEPWVELPAPEGGVRVLCKRGELPPPDVPDIPAEDEFP
jgi:hypothetical protein